MGYDPQTCHDKLTKAGYNPLCDQIPNAPRWHCADMLNQDPNMHSWCASFYDPNNPQSDKYLYAPVAAAVCLKRDSNGNIVSYQYFPPNQILDQCMKLRQQDNSWNYGQCYCCCSCLAYGTMVAVPKGYKPIEQIAKGDAILAGTMRQADGRINLQWNPITVTASMGVNMADTPVMIYISFGEGDKTGDLICSTDQVFMLADGKLITADRLVPGDQLLDKDGNPVTLRTVAMGGFKGGIHHVATQNLDALTLDNHLILAGGVVAGDYNLQLVFPSLPAAWKHEAAETRPVLGTPEYHDAYGHLRTNASVLFGSVPQIGSNRLVTRSGRFTFFVNAGLNANGPDIPGIDTVSFLTTAQSQDLLENGEQMPLSNPVPKGAVENLFRIFSGFYPDFVFYLDWYRMEPNIYAFEQYGQKVILVTGGLARMVGFNYEGMAMGIAHAIARFVPNDQPKGIHGYTCTGGADYVAFGLISRYIWYGNRWMEYLGDAYEQVKSLFGQIGADAAAGNPADVLNEPSIACRLQAMQCSVGGGPLPTCCGGPALPEIGIQNATATADEIVLTLTVAPTEDSATVIDNYLITPETVIKSVTVDAQVNFVIHLEAALEKGKTYTVVIRNLTSILGSGVDPERNQRDVAVE